MRIVAALGTVIAWTVGSATTQGDPLATVALMDGAALVPRATGLVGAPPSPQVSFVADPFMRGAMPALTHSGSLTVDNAVAEPGVPGTNDELRDTPAQTGRNAPPDTTPYVRPAVPEDYAPGGQEAIPSESSKPLKQHK